MSTAAAEALARWEHDNQVQEDQRYQFNMDRYVALRSEKPWRQEYAAMLLLLLIPMNASRSSSGGGSGGGDEVLATSWKRLLAHGSAIV